MAASSDDSEAYPSLGDVVGGGHLAVGEKGENFAPPGLDLLEEHLSRRMGNANAHQAGQHIVSLGHVTRNLQAFSSFADPERPKQMIADLGDKGPVPAVDGVLNIAQHVGEADLMLAPQFLLARIAIRNPDVRMMAAQHVLGKLRARRLEGHCQWGRPWCA
jgi:hypothetical protein